MTPPSNDNSGRITNKQIVDAINKLTIRVEVMANKLDSEITKTDKVIGDHETRIRSLEKLVWTSSWVTSIVTVAAGGIIAAIITNTVK